MIHVMNPFQMSIAMFRLTAAGMEYQMQVMKAVTAIAMAPMKAVMEPEADEDGQTAKKTAAAAGNGRAAKPAARRSHGASKTGASKTRRPRKPSNPPAMPEPAGKPAATDEDDAVESVPV